MSVYEKNNKFVSYFIILIWLFILVLFSKDEFNIMQENIDTKDTYNEALKIKRDKIQSLNNIKNELKIKKWEISKEVEKYSQIFTENELINYFYWYIETLDSKKNELTIKSINFSEWVKNELWFIESNINLNISVIDKNTMMNFLNFLTEDKSKYKFFINNFSYPNDGKEWWFSLAIPLKLFYR